MPDLLVDFCPLLKLLIHHLMLFDTKSKTTCNYLGVKGKFMIKWSLIPHI
jgi:hypothetical protein